MTVWFMFVLNIIVGVLLHIAVTLHEINKKLDKDKEKK